MSRDNPFVFPYRVVVQHRYGSVETLDPEFLPLPIDRNPALRLTFGGIAGSWEVERPDDEAEFAFTESEFAADPTRRMGTILLRRAGPG